MLDGRPARSNFYTTSYISLILALTATTGHERTKLRKSPKQKNKKSRKEIYLSEVGFFAAAAAAVDGEVGWRVWPRAADRRRLKRLNERTPKPADRQDRHTAINIERKKNSQSTASPSTKQNSILLAMICHPKGERHSHSHRVESWIKINTPNLHSSETSALSFLKVWASRWVCNRPPPPADTRKQTHKVPTVR